MTDWIFEPRATGETKAIAPIVEFMGKKAVRVETIADNTMIDKLVRKGFTDQFYKNR